MSIHDALVVLHADEHRQAAVLDLLVAIDERNELLAIMAETMSRERRVDRQRRIEELEELILRLGRYHAKYAAIVEG